MKSCIRPAFTAALLACTANASATLFQANDARVGGQQTVLDDHNGLQWLSLNATSGMSYSEIDQRLSSTPGWSAYRWATESEILGLFSEADIPDPNDPGPRSYYGTEANAEPVATLIDLLGPTYRVHSGGVLVLSTVGYFGAPYRSSVNGLPSAGLAELHLRMGVPVEGGATASFASAATSWSSLPVGTSYSFLGGWLVSTVPEASSAGLIAAGLVLLGMVRRRTLPT